MEFRDFLSLSTALVNGSTEAEWRSAVSRAYYAAFHVARQLLLGLRFTVPGADRAQNSGRAQDTGAPQDPPGAGDAGDEHPGQ